MTTINNELEELYQLSNQLKSLTGRIEKEEFIAKHKDNEKFKMYLRSVLDTLLVYGIADKKLKKAMSNEKLKNGGVILGTINSLLDLFEYLKVNNTGRDENVALVAVFIYNQPQHLHEWLIESITKTFKMGVTAKTVNKALGEDLISEFEIQRGKSYSDYKERFKDKDKSISEKLNGCFTARTRVNMADGTMKQIKDVEIGDLVLSFNEETKEISSKKVTDKFYNGRKKKEEWLKMSIDKTFGRYVIGTLDHKVFTPKGWTKIKDLKIGDEVHSYNYIFTETQKQIILGSGLGDATLIKDNKEKNPLRLRFAHSEKDKDYTKKLTQLMRHFQGMSKKAVSGYGSVIHQQYIKTMDSLPNHLHSNDNIQQASYTFTDDILNNMDVLALAIYYMDDGSLLLSQEDGYMKTKNISPRASFCTNRHKSENIDRFIKFLEGKFDIKAYKQKHKILDSGEQSYIVNLSTDGTAKLFDLIAPYVPEEMRYKISKKWRDVEPVHWWEDEGEIGLSTNSITNIENYTTSDNIKSVMDSYDLEVEHNHTYFVENVAVHNCRGITFINNGSVRIISRQNKEITGLIDISEDMKNLPDGVYEGELIVKERHLYRLREVLQNTTKIVNSKSKDKKLDYGIFDYLTFEEFHSPSNSRNYFKRRECNPVNTLKSDSVFMIEELYRGTDEDIIYQLLDEVVERGGEGLMGNLDEQYKKGKTHHILKIKKKYTSDLKIIGYEEGSGKYKGMLGALVLEYKNNTLGCSGMTDDLRKEFWDNQDKYLGCIVEIEHEQESWDSKTGLPSLEYPAFQMIRKDKDEASYAHE